LLSFIHRFSAPDLFTAIVESRKRTGIFGREGKEFREKPSGAISCNDKAVLQNPGVRIRPFIPSCFSGTLFFMIFCARMEKSVL